MRFTFRTLEAADVDALLTWRYEPPYDRYDPAGEDGYRHASIASASASTIVRNVNRMRRAA